jgi:hypothetical protein
MIVQARPEVLARQARALLCEEIAKGCRPEISRHPVPLGPPFREITNVRDFLIGKTASVFSL